VALVTVDLLAPLTWLGVVLAWSIGSVLGALAIGRVVAMREAHASRGA
jgi:hypothetical protein